jgi:hypothetical protein
MCLDIERKQLIPLAIGLSDGHVLFILVEGLPKVLFFLHLKISIRNFQYLIFSQSVVISTGHVNRDTSSPEKVFIS